MRPPEHLIHAKKTWLVSLLFPLALACGGGGGSNSNPNPNPTPMPGRVVSISPMSAELAPGQSQTFTAAVNGAPSSAVTWSVVEPGGGTVNGGAYTAPTAKAVYHVRATSSDDPTKYAEATVTVAQLFGVLEGSTAKDIQGQDASGQTKSLYGLKPKVIWLNIATMWCGPCKAEAPQVQAIYDQYKGQGLEVFQVLSQNESGANPAAADLQRWASTYGSTFTLINDPGQALNSWNCEFIPTNVLIDKKGVIRYRAYGFTEADVRSRITALLAEAPGQAGPGPQWAPPPEPPRDVPAGSPSLPGGPVSTPRSPMIPLLPGLGLAALLSLPPAPGPVQDFTLRKLDGSSFQLKGALGKQVVLIDFWATWCPPCVSGLKKLQAIHEKYPDVLVLAVSVDEARALSKVDQFIQSKGYTFTVLLDPESQVARRFNPSLAVPFTLILDRRGEIAYTHSGYVPGDEQEVMKTLDALRP